MTSFMWEAVVREAAAIRNEVDRAFGSFHGPEVRSGLTAILDRLACSRADDLPARAVRELADAWLKRPATWTVKAMLAA